jgi:hypothetical protein
VAEYLATGLTVVLNGDIGDQADLAAEPGASVVMNSWSDEELRCAAATVLPLATRPYPDRAAITAKVAQARFSLAGVGVPRYLGLYRALSGS